MRIVATRAGSRLDPAIRTGSATRTWPEQRPRTPVPAARREFSTEMRIGSENSRSQPARRISESTSRSSSTKESTKVAMTQRTKSWRVISKHAMMKNASASRIPRAVADLAARALEAEEVPNEAPNCWTHAHHHRCARRNDVSHLARPRLALRGCAEYDWFRTCRAFGGAHWRVNPKNRA